MEILLVHDKFRRLTNDDSDYLISCLDLLAEEYFFHVFSLDWRMFSRAIAKHNSSSRKLLKETILKKFVEEGASASLT